MELWKNTIVWQWHTMVPPPPPLLLNSSVRHGFTVFFLLSLLRVRFAEWPSERVWFNWIYSCRQSDFIRVDCVVSWKVNQTSNIKMTSNDEEIGERANALQWSAVDVVGAMTTAMTTATSTRRKWKAEWNWMRKSVCVCVRVLLTIVWPFVVIGLIESNLKEKPKNVLALCCINVSLRNGSNIAEPLQIQIKCDVRKSCLPP